MRQGSDYIYMYVGKSLGGFVEFDENWLIMGRYFSGLAPFTRMAPLSNVYIHSVPDKSCINQRFRSSMRWMRPCKFEKTCFRNFSVTYSRMCPVDTSHQIKLLSNDLSNLKFMVDDFECRNRVNSEA